VWQLQSDIIISRDREASLLRPLLLFHMKGVTTIIWKRPEVRKTNSQGLGCAFMVILPVASHVLNT